MITRQSPSGVVTRFIADRSEWSQSCHSRSKDPTIDPVEASRIAEKTYEALLSRYCRSDLKHQPYSFGWTKDPAVEKVVSERIDGDSAVVISQRTYLRSITEFEYRLILRDQRWLLEAKDLIDGDQRLPCL
jgi:hypothetical protein